MSDKQELLPCPFCGGRAERIDIEDGENAGGSCISCTVCLASSNVEFEFKENFVSNWNTRPQQAVALAGEVERLREATEILGAARRAHIDAVGSTPGGYSTSAEQRAAYGERDDRAAEVLFEGLAPLTCEHVDAILSALRPQTGGTSHG